MSWQFWLPGVPPLPAGQAMSTPPPAPAPAPAPAPEPPPVCQKCQNETLRRIKDKGEAVWFCRLCGWKKRITG